MTKLELVVLDEIPTQVGTEFYIVTLGCVNSYDTFIVVGDGAALNLVGGSEFKLTDIDISDGMAILAKPHAELRALYKETGENFKDWEVKGLGGEWSRLYSQPNWFAEDTYRYTLKYKQKTITINCMEIPIPETEEPNYKDIYYMVDTARKSLNPIKYAWENSKMERLWLKRGLVHKSKESAQKHINALILASGGEIDD